MNDPNYKIVVNHRSQISCIFPLLTYTKTRIMPWDQVLEKFTIKNHCHNTHLNNQSGVRAKIDIPANTVLGIYCGVWIHADELESMYPDTPDTNQNSIIYKYHFTIDTETMIKSMQILTYQNYLDTHQCNCVCKHCHIYYKDDNCKDCKVCKDCKDCYKMKEKQFLDLKDDIIKDLELNILDNSVVSPLLLPPEKRPIIIYINDPRANILEPDLTEQDKKYQNAAFRGVVINGIEYTYAVTNRNIRKGEEIMIYYGQDYCFQ